MTYFCWIAGVLLGLAWFSRVLDAAVGMPGIADISRPEWDKPAPSPPPRLTIVVPARNEEASLEPTLRCLLALDYPDYEIVAVNDRSHDRTAEIMQNVASQAGGSRLKVIHISELPSGWMGKTHAMWTGAQQASGEWLLFTDADIVFRPDSLRRALAYAEATSADHVVLFPRLVMRGFGEHMMLGFFQLLFVFGHRPWKVADPRTRDYMGVGAFNLVRRRIYWAMGTYRALRFEVLDDMKLGKLIKESGFAQRNVFGQDLISVRWARGAMGVVRNLSKNFFALMLFRWPRTLGASLLLLFLNLGPFLGVWLAPGWSRAPYGLALLSIFLIYLGMSWYAPISPLYFFMHPISTALFVYTMLRSMALTLWRGGVVWRGTKYPLDELRRMVSSG